MLSKGTILGWSVIPDSREIVSETERNSNLTSFTHMYDDGILANDVMKLKACHGRTIFRRKSASFAILNMIMKSSDFEPDILRIVQHSGVLISHLVIELDSHLVSGNSLLDSHKGDFRPRPLLLTWLSCPLTAEPVALLQARASIQVGNIPDMYISNVSAFVFPYVEKKSPAPMANMKWINYF